MKLILFILLLLPSFVIAQVAPGDAVTFGKGSAANGQYKYVTGHALKKIATLNGVHGTVIDINNALTGRERNGTWFNVRIKNVNSRFFVNIDSAINRGEITLINGVAASKISDKYEKNYGIMVKEERGTPSSLQSLINAIDRGMTLTLGTGTENNGDFAYVKTSETSWLAVASAGPRHNPGIINAPAEMSGLKMTVKKTRRFGNNKLGFKKIAIVAGGNIVNYQIDLYGAITSGEVVAVNGKPITRNGHWASEVKAPQATAIAQQKDKAQKLLDWKKLLDVGGITQHEYDSIKAVIMHN